MSTKQIEWVCVPVIIDNTTSELFEIPAPNENPDQQLTFRVTQSTADLVPQDFGRYEPSLQRMADHWREEKARVMRGHNGQTYFADETNSVKPHSGNQEI